jgi:DNA-directed RNA polymerase specialized sigma24 family protein
VPDARRALEDWNERHDEDCIALVHTLLAAQPLARSAVWRNLMQRIGPHLEHWAESSFLLRRCHLANPDDARSVLVAALERLQANDFANLRKFATRSDPGEGSDRADTATLSCIVKLAADDDVEPVQPTVPGDQGTPLRAWLLVLLSYVVKDHVRDRLGWAQEGTKRDVNTHATRFADQDERGERPPITDFLTMQRFLAEVVAFIETFPADMQRATRLWLDDGSVAEIAKELSITPSQVTPLIRAAKARLRERFRGEWDQLIWLGV